MARHTQGDLASLRSRADPLRSMNSLETGYETPSGSPLGLSQATPGRPRVCVVVPSWQQGRFLSQCLESLRRQTYEELDVIVVDNLSTDTTGQVLEAFAPHLRRVVKEGDGGQTLALRKGFSLTRADILGWLNADDMLLPDAVARVVDRFCSTSSPDVVLGHGAALSRRGQFLRYLPGAADPAAGLHLRDVIPQAACFFTRKAYEAVDGLDPTLAYTMDWDLWCRLAQARCRFSTLDEVLAGVRFHPASKTALGGKQRLLELLAVSSRHGPARLPLLAMVHFCATYLPVRLRRGGRTLAGPVFRVMARGPRPSDAVHGLGRDGVAVQPEVRMRLPVCAPVRCVWLQIVGGIAPGEVAASLAGEVGEGKLRREGTRVVWRFPDRPFLTEIDVQVLIRRHTGAGVRLALRWC